MIDLETLGVEPDSVVMTLGAIKFDPFSDAEPHTPLYLRGDVEEQSEQYGRSIDDNTLAWWATQPQAIQDEAFGDHSDRVTVQEMLRQLNKWCVGLDYIWCQGPPLTLLSYKTYTRQQKNLHLGTIGKLETVVHCLL